MKEIGLFGGTFDPVHNGHLHIARAFADTFHPECVIFIPAGKPYHRDNPTGADAGQRLEMVRLAIESDDRFAVSDCDTVREGNTYTIDTVSLFRQVYPTARLWWLMGMDSLLQLHRWHRFPALATAVNFAVAGRAGETLQKASPELVPFLTAALEKNANRPDGHDGGRLHFLQTSENPAEASRIRHDFQAGRISEASRMLPENVARYIISNRLYAG